MSVLQAVAATPTPSLSPSPSPIVNVVTAHDPSVWQTVGDYLNHIAAVIPQHELILLAGVLAVLVQMGLNKFRFLDSKSKLWVSVYNWLVSFALPFALTGLATLLANGSLVKYGAIVYAVSQIVYFTGKSVVEKLKLKLVDQNQVV